MSGERDQLWARLEKASFLTVDEKRAAAGYGASLAAAVEKLRARRKVRPCLDGQTALRAVTQNSTATI